MCAESRGERGGVGLAAAEPDQRVAVADAVLHGAAVVEPGMRQPHAGKRARRVVDVVVGRLAGLGCDERRAGVVIAELRAGHLVGLALLDVGDRGKIGAGRGALRRVVVDVGLPLRAPLAPAQRRVARGADVALAGRAAARFRRTRAAPVRPSLAACRRASSRGRWRRRRRCSCRARRSGSPDAPRRRRAARGRPCSGRRAAGSAAIRRHRASRISPAWRRSSRTSPPCPRPSPRPNAS